MELQAMNDWKHQIANDLMKGERVTVTPPNGNPGPVPPWMIAPPVPLPPVPTEPAPQLPGPVDPCPEG